MFFVVEESLDVFRGTWSAGRSLREMEGVDELDLGRVDRGVGMSRDCWSSAGAGMVTGGLWSAWHGFPISTASRTIRLGVVGGLAFGLVQDGVRWAKVRWGGEEEGVSWVRLGARNRQIGGAGEGA